MQGVLGSLLIKLNIAAAVYRRNSILHECPILEVTGATAITAAVSYLVSPMLFVDFGGPDTDISVGCFPEVRVRLCACGFANMINPEFLLPNL